jgi:hypothetical protein
MTTFYKYGCAHALKKLGFLGATARGAGRIFGGGALAGGALGTLGGGIQALRSGDPSDVLRGAAIGAGAGGTGKLLAGMGSMAGLRSALGEKGHANLLQFLKSKPSPEAWQAAKQSLQRIPGVGPRTVGGAALGGAAGLAGGGLAAHELVKKESSIRRLIDKVAEGPSNISTGPTMSSVSSGRTSATPGRQPSWGLGGPTPQGFTSHNPASIQAGASPGGPPQLQGAPMATPATRPGPSPVTGAPVPNPQVQAPSASGITGPIESASMPAAGTGTSLGIPSGGNVKSQGMPSAKPAQ